MVGSGTPYIYMYICSYAEHMCLQKCIVEGFVVAFQLFFVCVFCNKGTLVFALQPLSAACVNL